MEQQQCSRHSTGRPTWLQLQQQQLLCCVLLPASQLLWGSGNCQAESDALEVWPGMLFSKSPGLSNCDEQLPLKFSSMLEQSTVPLAF